MTGNSSDKTKLGSIALVGWSPNTITAFHPEGHGTGGIDHSAKEHVKQHVYALSLEQLRERPHEIPARERQHIAHKGMRHYVSPYGVRLR